MNTNPLDLLRKILKSKDEHFALIAEDFVPVKFVSIVKFRDLMRDKEWRGEDKDGNSIIMRFIDAYLLFGIGESELLALKDVRKIAYFNYDDITIKEINKHLGIEFPEFYDEE